MLTSIYFAVDKYSRSICFLGVTVGTVVGMSVSGFLCMYFGWEYAFYVFGENSVYLRGGSYCLVSLHYFD